MISGTSAPVNTARPTVSGTPQPGEELTAATGTWSNGVRTYAFQWQRCDAAGANCNDVTGATGRTYGVRAADIGGTIRVSVTATNLVGSNTATSDRTEVVKTGTPPRDDVAGEPPPDARDPQRSLRRCACLRPLPGLRRLAAEPGDHRA